MPDTFYHVDRWDDLSTGQTIELEPVEEWDPAVTRRLAERFPDGLSHHGRHYATQDLHGEDTDAIWDFACELLFEHVRATRFPDRPSRLQSVFGFPTRAAAERFVAEFEDDAVTVREVTAARSFRADMHLVDAPDLARGLHRADHYWRGETFREAPLWEVLLVPPVEVGPPV